MAIGGDCSTIEGSEGPLKDKGETEGGGMFDGLTMGERNVLLYGVFTGSGVGSGPCAAKKLGLEKSEGEAVVADMGYWRMSRPKPAWVSIRRFGPIPWGC